MPRRQQPVTDAELAVLEALWEQGPATIRRLSEVLYPRGGNVEYATVQKLLERLEAKRCVARERGSFAHRFTASVDRNDVIAQHLQEVADKLCGGSMTPLLTHLVQSKALSDSDLAMLRKLIDEAE